VSHDDLRLAQGDIGFRPGPAPAPDPGSGAPAQAPGEAPLIARPTAANEEATDCPFSSWRIAARRGVAWCWSSASLADRHVPAQVVNWKQTLKVVYDIIV